MNKKASLNLSINAIVVLILAITMLGLGLGFMKTMFGKVTEDFGDISENLQNELIKKLETTSSRIEFNKYVINAKRGDDKVFYYGMFNNVGSSAAFKVNPTCSQAIGGGDPSQITLSTFASVVIEDNEAKVSALKVNIDSNAEPDTYDCVIKVSYDQVSGSSTTTVAYAEKEFTIRVK